MGEWHGLPFKSVGYAIHFCYTSSHVTYKSRVHLNGRGHWKESHCGQQRKELRAVGSGVCLISATMYMFPLVWEKGLELIPCILYLNCSSQCFTAGGDRNQSQVLNCIQSTLSMANCLLVELSFLNEGE